MRQSAELVLLMSLTFFTGPAHAVDRGQFENVPDDIRAWFKGVRSQDGVPCCDISDGHRTEYDVRAGAYWVPINGLWWRVPEKAIIRNAGNPLGWDRRQRKFLASFRIISFLSLLSIVRSVYI